MVALAATTFRATKRRSRLARLWRAGDGKIRRSWRLKTSTSSFLFMASSYRLVPAQVTRGTAKAGLAARPRVKKELLRMPKFPFDPKQREAVMTFVLGLTNEAPASRYIYQPGPRQQAIVQGRHVLDKYNCAGCHILDMDRWNIAYAPNEFDQPATT